MDRQDDRLALALSGSTIRRPELGIRIRESRQGRHVDLNDEQPAGASGMHMLISVESRRQRSVPDTLPARTITSMPNSRASISYALNAGSRRNGACWITLAGVDRPSDLPRWIICEHKSPVGLTTTEFIAARGSSSRLRTCERVMRSAV
jgi:hypothetical protein